MDDRYRRARRRRSSRGQLRLGAGFTHGIDRLDWLTLDQVAIEADTLSLKASYTFTPMTTFEAGYAYPVPPGDLRCIALGPGSSFARRPELTKVTELTTKERSQRGRTKKHWTWLRDGRVPAPAGLCDRARGDKHKRRSDRWAVCCPLTHRPSEARTRPSLLRQALASPHPVASQVDFARPLCLWLRGSPGGLGALGEHDVEVPRARTALAPAGVGLRARRGPRRRRAEIQPRPLPRSDRRHRWRRHELVGRAARPFKFYKVDDGTGK